MRDIKIEGQFSGHTKIGDLLVPFQIGSPVGSPGGLRPGDVLLRFSNSSDAYDFVRAVSDQSATEPAATAVAVDSPAAAKPPRRKPGPKSKAEKAAAAATDAKPAKKKPGPKPGSRRRPKTDSATPTPA